MDHSKDPFLGKTRTFWPNGLPQGFEILSTVGTHQILLNPKKLQILVLNFVPLFKVTSGSLEYVRRQWASENGRTIFTGQKS